LRLYPPSVTMPAQFSILLVDDDPLLAEIINRASRRSFPEASFVQVYSATQAITYLNNLDGYGPKLILLDLDLQDKVNGLDFLIFLRSHDEARFLPVVMLTASQLPSDVVEAYTIGASSFTIKPFSFGDWVLYLGTLKEYWLRTVTLPLIRFTKKA